MGFLAELRRRKVFRVAIAYAAVAFVVVQVAELFFPALLLPDWTFRLVVVLAVLGFPIVLVLAWAFELTPEGVRPTQPQAAELDVTHPSRGVARQLLITIAFIGGLAVAGWLLWRSPDEARSSEVRAIAVLPFANMSPDPDSEEYFADGMTEALISQLGQIGALTVISRTSVMRYADTDKTIPEIAAELGVDAIIEGSVLKADQEVRISATLVQAFPESQLWAESYKRPIRDILALQSEVARAIAERVQVTLTPREEARLAAAGAVDPEAYEAYLRGRFLWNQRNKESLLRAIEYFERAIEIDSTYALAWSGLADIYIVLPAHSTVSMAEANPPAAAAARRAVSLADHLGEAHAALASVLWNEWRWDEVEPEYLRAIELNPGYATGRQWYGDYLSGMGRYGEAIEQLERAHQLDPLSGIVATSLARTYFAAGLAADAVALLEEAIAVDPTFLPTHLELISIYEHSGRLEEAVAAYRASPPEPFLALVGVDPEGVADRLQSALEAGGAPAYFALLVQATRSVNTSKAAEYAALAGQIDQAFELLDELVEERHFDLTEIKGQYRWASLRDDPRFDALLRRIGLAD